MYQNVSQLSHDCHVLCTGTYNIVHAGHCELFEFAARYSSTGKITVGINAQPYLIKKYGHLAVPLVNRAYVLRSNRYVDRVVVFREDHPGKLIRQLRPAYYVRGPDYAGKDLPEAEALYDVGCELVICRMGKIHNASELVKALPEDVFAPLGYDLEAVVDLKQRKESVPKFLSLLP